MKEMIIGFSQYIDDQLRHEKQCYIDSWNIKKTLNSMQIRYSKKIENELINELKKEYNLTIDNNAIVINPQIKQFNNYIVTKKEVKKC